MKISISFLFLLFSVSTIAQPELKFERYTSKQGLVHDDVLCVYQDTYGFIWLGTKSGCSRFDGLNFTNYSSDIQSSKHFPIGWVYTIIQDNNNKLWFGLGDYILVYDYEKDNFGEVRLKLTEDKSAKNYGASELFCDSHNNIWCSLNYDNYVVVIDPDSKEVKKQYKLADNISYDIIEDKEQNIWIGTTSNGLFMYNPTKDSMISFKHIPEDPNSLSSNTVKALYEDADGDIWVGTMGGGLCKLILNKKDYKKSFFKSFKHSPTNEKTISHNSIYAILEDTKRGLWIGTINGLCLFDESNNLFHRYFYDDRDIESVNDNIIRAFFIDNSNNLWIGTRMGLAKLKNQRFKTYHHSLYKNSLRSNKVQCVTPDEHDNLYIGSPLGIDFFDQNNDYFTVFSRINNDRKNVNAPPNVILLSSDKNIWVGTWEGGMNFFNTKTGQYDYFTNDPGFADCQSVNSQLIFSIIEDSSQNIWIGTLNNGINIYDGKNGKFSYILSDENKPGSLSSNRINCLLYDSKKKLWAGTKNGLNLLTGKDPYTFKHYLVDTSITYTTGSNFITCIHESQYPFLWIGTQKGLYRLDQHTGKIDSFYNEDGLPSSIIQLIQEDDAQNLWISTNRGLTRFDQKAYLDKQSTQKIYIKSFYEDDGLQNHYLPLSGCKLSDGTLVFGGSNGLSVFHPDSIFMDTIEPKIVATYLKVFNRPVSIGEMQNNQIILKKSILLTDTLSLNYQNNNFTIGFAALNYTMPSKNLYSYKMEGFDKEWSYIHNEKTKATYTNLPYNRYTFHVRASNYDGVWMKNSKKIIIDIVPPWWLTFWFKSAVVIFIIILILIFIKSRTYNLKKQKRKLEDIVRLRTHELKEMNTILVERQDELEQQTEQILKMNTELRKSNIDLARKTEEVEKMAKIVHETDQKQLRFFANISHEFRTPLTLITGPLAKYVKIKALKSVSDWDKIQDYLQLAYRNSLRLSRLVNQILDFRKLSQNVKQLNLQNNNIAEFIQQVVNTFSVLAEAKGIQLLVKSEELKVRSEEMSDTKELITYHSSLITQFWFDPDIMEKILYNLISNAIKYTPEGGEISIAIGVGVETQCIASLQNQLAIKISDTGIGIKPENIDKIFDRFYRVETHGRVETQGRVSLHENQIEGSGIGLAYTKELVALHKGTISVESEVGRGSSFTISFPVIPEKKTVEIKPIPIKGNNTISLDYIRKMVELSDYSYKHPGGKINKENVSLSRNKGLNTLLIVEDSEDMRGYLHAELKDIYNVVLAEDGIAGFETAKRDNPDLILSDVMMPGISGTQLCNKLRNNEDTSHIPIILLTAKAGDENILNGIETGADDYILKPFNIEILKAKIHGLIESRKKLREKFSNSILVSPEEITTSSIDSNFIAKAVDIVEKHMHNQDFDNNQFVGFFKLSRATVYKKIKTLTNQSVSEFIRTIRLKKAAKMLLSEDKTIGEIAFCVGFKERSDFTRYFTKHFGKNPSQFIKDQ